jgi:catechol 2,3-dioxygenase-like lactoylglutathione lyase family enzyme
VTSAPDAEPNVKQAVPFFMVTDMDASLRFYVDGLGFTLTNKWTQRGRIEWCWLEHGTAAMMLQEYRNDADHPGKPDGGLGQGVSVCFMCADAIALYHAFLDRGVDAQRPFVGNGLWVTSVKDPDGYRLDFESPADQPEETVYRG